MQINQPKLFPGTESATGLGDINPTFFLSPAKPGNLIWGFGPTFTLPTATDELLGSEKWSMGPAAVALTIQGPWVFGALMNNQWSFAGNNKRDKVNQLLLQPFANYNLPDGWYLTSSPPSSQPIGRPIAAATSGPSRSAAAQVNCLG